MHVNKSVGLALWHFSDGVRAGPVLLTTRTIGYFTRRLEMQGKDESIVLLNAKEAHNNGSVEGIVYLLSPPI